MMTFMIRIITATLPVHLALRQRVGGFWGVEPRLCSDQISLKEKQRLQSSRLPEAVAPFRAFLQ